MTEYNSEQELIADGFALTPNIWHSGKGNGKVYEKITEGTRVYFGVDVDGSVSPYDAKVGVAMKPEAQEESKSEVVEAEPIAESKEESLEVQEETAPEAQEE